MTHVKRQRKELIKNHSNEIVSKGTFGEKIELFISNMIDIKRQFNESDFKGDVLKLDDSNTSNNFHIIKKNIKHFISHNIDFYSHQVIQSIRNNNIESIKHKINDTYINKIYSGSDFVEEFISSKIVILGKNDEIDNLYSQSLSVINSVFDPYKNSFIELMETNNYNIVAASSQLLYCIPGKDDENQFKRPTMKNTSYIKKEKPESVVKKPKAEKIMKPKSEKVEKIKSKREKKEDSIKIEDLRSAVADVVKSRSKYVKKGDRLVALDKTMYKINSILSSGEIKNVSDLKKMFKEFTFEDIIKS